MTAERELEILETAIRLAFRDGLAKANANRVAAELGIRPSLVYYYFPKEKVLFERMVQHIVMTNNALVQNALAELGDARSIEKLVAYFEYNLVWGEQHPDQAVVLLCGFVEGCHDDFMNELLTRALTAGEDKLYGMLTAGLAEGEFELAEPAREVARALHQCLIGCLAHQLVFTKTARSADYVARIKRILGGFIT